MHSTSLPLYGSIVKVYLVELAYLVLFTDKVVDQWLYLRNVHVKQIGVVAIQSSSKLVFLDAQHPTVIGLNKKYQARLLVEKPLVQPDLLVRDTISVTLHPDQPFTTISSIIANSQVPNKYRTKVKVESFYPQSFSHFAIPYYSCLSCTSMFPQNINNACERCGAVVSTTNIQYVYMFSLLIYDDTGSMEVIVFGADANRFLNNVPATNFKECNWTQSLLQRKINTLKSNNSVSNTLDCCIKSYLSVEHKKCYRIFDTLLSS